MFQRSADPATIKAFSDGALRTGVRTLRSALSRNLSPFARSASSRRRSPSFCPVVVSAYSLLRRRPVNSVDLETARRAPGLRLVVLARVPSPWSEAAKGIFHIKRIPFLAVRCGLRDQAIREWTGVPNAPVALYEDEPPRSQWSDILALAERLGGATALVPAESELRVRVYGLAHEICSEGGLLWCGRLILIDHSLRSGGERGFPLPAAQYLAKKYGYAPERLPFARRRVSEVLASLAGQLARSQAAGSSYLVGDRLTALDIYSATALAVFAPLPDELCPLDPEIRRFFEPNVEEARALLPAALLEHRELVYRRHLELPISL
jgi:glutathione S-transferase